MILKLVIRNQLPRDTRKPVILIKAPVEYVEIHQQKKTNISKITAPLLLKLGGSLDHMYTKAQNFLAPTLKCPHGIGHRTTISSPNASGSLFWTEFFLEPIFLDPENFVTV